MVYGCFMVVLWDFMGFDGGFMVVSWDLPSDKPLPNNGKIHHAINRQNHVISTGPFSIAMSNYENVYYVCFHDFTWFSTV